MAFLPIGIQTFRDIRTNDFVYVDKTALIYELVRPGKGYYFFSRPRRFGKSLLVSTLGSLFAGDAELFDGLDIAKTGYEFPAYPVLTFDFSMIPHRNEAELEQGLLYILDRMAQDHGVTLPVGTPPGPRFRSLLRELGKRGQVVVLVDGYDKPIVAHIGNPDMADKCWDVLRGFLGVLKSSDHLIRFVFITGITKLANISTCSEMNNLDDISQDRRYADLLGWTEQEVAASLCDHVDAFAEELAITREELTDHLRAMYNGYRFSSKDVTVFNPWSILNALEKRELHNYWFDSDSSTFLMEMLQERLANEPAFSMANLYDYKMSASMLPSINIRNLTLETVFFQVGYLTIKKTSGSFTDIYYHLGFPNREVEQSLLHAVHNFLSGQDSARATDDLDRLVALAQDGD